MQYHNIDINVDLGESVGNEAEIMPYISSCNIACGGHTGDNETMRRVVRLAKKHNIKIGAHPSFPDKENFGRVSMEISSAALYKSIKQQIRDLLVILKEEHARLCHIKPHGALYNLAVVDEKIANTIIEAIKSIALPIKLYAPYNSVIANLAMQNDIKVKCEAFADRNYNDDLTLVSRTKNNALLVESDSVLNHVCNMVLNKKVTTINGNNIDIKAETFCVHGDNSEAINLVKNLKKDLEIKGIYVV